MDKNTFVKTIKALHLQYKSDLAFAENMGKCFPSAFEANLIPNNDLLSQQLIEILEHAMFEHEFHDPENPQPSWIEYYCHELEFGEKFYPGCVKDQEDVIDISTPEKLYDFLHQRNQLEGYC
jgi:hypothetical protein